MMQHDELISAYFSALAHPNRIRIVEMLRDGELCQCIFPEALGIEQSNLSRHIKILTSAGVLLSRREGVKILLSVADPRVIELIDAITSMIHSRLTTNVSVLEREA